MSMQAYSAPTSPPQSNPDTRPLPLGWVTQYDINHKTWFYVNTNQTPLETTWINPLGAPPDSSQPPPYNSTDVATNNPGPSVQQGQPQDRGLGSVFSRHKYDGNNYGGPSPQGGYYPSQGNSGPPSQGYSAYGPPAQQWAPPPQGYDGPSGPYGGYPQYGGPPQSQAAYAQDSAKKKTGMSTGAKVALGVGGGLLGGLLLEDAIDDAYDDGFDNGADDFGGGDW